MAKKANGEGTFTDLPSGKVRYQIYIDGKRKSFTGKNKTDCRNQYKMFLRNYDLRPLDSEIRLKAWMERYLTSCRKDSMLPSSYHQLEATVYKGLQAIKRNKWVDRVERVSDFPLYLYIVAGCAD